MEVVDITVLKDDAVELSADICYDFESDKEKQKIRDAIYVIDCICEHADQDFSCEGDIKSYAFKIEDGQLCVVVRAASIGQERTVMYEGWDITIGEDKDA